MHRIIYDAHGGDCYVYEKYGDKFGEETQYISHLGYMYDADIPSGILFGVTQSESFTKQ